LELDHAGVDHLVIQVVAFAGALADAGEHRHAAMALGDVVDQLLDQHSLAHAGAAKQADLAALQVRAQQIHDLDPRHQDFRRGRLVLEGRGGAVDRVGHLGVHWATLVDRLAQHVQDAAQRLRADGHADRRTGVHHLVAAHQAVGAVHGDAANGALTEFLRHFHHQRVAIAALGGQRVLDERKIALELHVQHGAENLGNPAYAVACHRLSSTKARALPWTRQRTVVLWTPLKKRLQSASAPEMISISSRVMLAWRVRL
jgi:peptide chain release factor 1